MILPNLFVIAPIRFPDLGEIELKQYQFVQLGDELTILIKERLALGLDRYGNPMRPLAPKYAKYKRQKGGSGIRDMRLTGNMLGSFGVVDSSDSHVSVSFRGATPQLKARFRQSHDAFLGLTPLEAAQADQKVTGYIVQNLRSAQLRTPGLGR